MPDTRPTFYGSFRESNAHHLEILDQAPALGVPIEVDVFDGASPATLLDTLEGATAVRFQKVLNDVGAFRFLISRDDPKAVPDLIDREHLIKIKMGGIYRFSGWAEVRKVQTLDAQEEEAGEVWEISGRDGIAYLDRAAMANYNLLPAPSEPIDGEWSWEAQPLGAIYTRCVEERLADSPSPIEFLTFDFDRTHDSLGASWTDTAKMRLTVGESLLAIWRKFTALGMDSRMRHDLRLQAFVELGRHYDITTGDGTVVLEAGKDFTGTVVKTRRTSDIKTREWVKGQTGTWFEVLRPDLEADPYIRRREGSLSFGSSTDPTTLQRAANADMNQRALQVEGGVEVEVWNGRYQPFVHYDVGDWITVHEPGVYQYRTFRIVGITIEQEEDDHKTTLALNSLELEDLLRLAAKMMGEEMSTSVSSTGAVGGGGGGGTGGGGSGTDYRVATSTGDSAGFLYDKMSGADGVTRSLVGPSGDRQVQLGLDDTLVQLKDEKGAPGGYAPLSSGILVPVEYLGSGVADDTTFLRGDGVWATPAGGGGGGGAGLPLEYDSHIKNGAIYYAPSANVWHGVPDTTLDIAAAVGDRIEYHGNWMWTQGSGSAKAKVEIVTAAGVLIRQVPTGTAAMGSSYSDTSKYDSVGITVPIVVEAGDLQSGRVYVRTAMFVSNVARGMYADSGYNGAFTLRNLETGGGGPRGLLYSSKSAADTPDDEFNVATLNAKWTAVAGTLGAASLLESGTAVNKYDLTTRPGWLLTQVGGSTSGSRDVRLRQTFTLPDGASIVVAVATPAPTVDDSRAENERQIGIALNQSDATEDTTPTVRLFAQEVDAAAANIQSLAGGHTSGSAGGTAPDQSWGEMLFLRIARSGLWYFPSYSRDGHTWVPFGACLMASAMTRLWLYDRVIAAASGTPVPIAAWAWVRQGGVGVDPWPW